MLKMLLAVCLVGVGGVAQADGSAALSQADGSCQILKWDPKATVRPAMLISSPGKYCLDRDYEVSCSMFEHGCGGEVITIRADNVDLDMRGHVVTATGTRAYSGVSGFGKNIRVHHGKFKGVGLGVYLEQAGSQAKAPIYAVPAYPVEKAAKFLITTLVVEEIDFVDVETAIMLSGSGNRIINNRIQTVLKNKVDRNSHSEHASQMESQVSIASYGPNLTFSGNTIVQRTDNRGVAAYTLYLRNADNALVADNRIRVTGSADKTVAIGLSNSRAVRLQNNTIQGAETKVEPDALSSESR
jgi:hypothetical protein